MARIPEAELELLKREVDLVALVRGSGVELRRHGADLVGRCPWHEDREPSLIVSPARGLWRCMGACQVGGSPIDWVMRFDHVTFLGAVQRLSTTAQLRPAPPAQPRPTNRPTAPTGLLGRVAACYAESLRRTPAALAYLEGRGLDNQVALERFRIGYASDSLLARFASDRPGLEALGLVNDQGAEHLAGCVVVPLVTLAGEVVGLYGRRIEPGRIRHVYLPGQRRGVFNPEAFAAGGELVLCEAVLDALTFWVHGIRNVSSAYGVNGFSADLHQAIRERRIARLVIAYDHDDAGERAALALARKLAGEGLACRRAVLPPGLDVNAYALHVEQPREALARLVHHAQPIAEEAAPCLSFYL